MSAIDDLPEDGDLLAAELAFGLLDGSEKQTAEARVGSDAAFATAWRRWQRYALALLAVSDVAPSASVWAAIEARLPANDIGASRAALRWWQAGTMVASMAAVMLGVVVSQRPAPVTIALPPPAAAPAPLVAVLTGKSGVLTISFDRATGRLTSAPNGIDIGDHAAELWVIPADGKPRSLGVIAASTPGWTKAPAPALASLAPGATLAITVEPPGGSPHGEPTGAVILSGKISAT